MSPRLYSAIGLFVLFFLLGCTKKEDVVSTLPTIVSINPTSGIPNTEVTIIGTNFKAGNNDNEVSFNGKLAIVVTSSTTQIIAKVPDGAGTGSVSVSNTFGSVSGPIFTYIEPLPIISSFSPLTGPYNTLVQINGSNFNSNSVLNIVKFNNLAAEVVSSTPNQIIAKVPKRAGVGPISVTVNGRTGQGTNFEYQFTTVVSTLAGSTMGFADGTGSSAKFNFPSGVAVDATGNIFVAERINNKIRKITQSGVVTTYAGSSAGSTDGDLTVAKFTSPNGLVFDRSGNLIVTELTRIRKITPDGIVSTIAGNINFGFANGSVAQFDFSTMSTIDSQGNIFVAELSNNRVRKITPNGDVTTFAGDGIAATTDGTGTAAQIDGPWGIVIDPQDNLYVTEFRGSKIRKISPSGVVTTYASSTMFSTTYGLVIDGNKNLYVASGNYIHKISSSGIVSTVAGLSLPGSTDGGTDVAKFNAPYSVALTSEGSLIIGERFNYRVRKIVFE
jgi:sugar lactone lactonase YvrE